MLGDVEISPREQKRQEEMLQKAEEERRLQNEEHRMRLEERRRKEEAEQKRLQGQVLELQRQQEEDKLKQKKQEEEKQQQVDELQLRLREQEKQHHHQQHTLMQQQQLSQQQTTQLSQLPHQPPKVQIQQQHLPRSLRPSQPTRPDSRVIDHTRPQMQTHQVQRQQQGRVLDYKTGGQIGSPGQGRPQPQVQGQTQARVMSGQIQEQLRTQGRMGAQMQIHQAQKQAQGKVTAQGPGQAQERVMEYRQGPGHDQGEYAGRGMGHSAAQTPQIATRQTKGRIMDYRQNRAEIDRPRGLNRAGTEQPTRTISQPRSGGVDFAVEERARALQRTGSEYGRYLRGAHNATLNKNAVRLPLTADNSNSPGLARNNPLSPRTITISRGPTEPTQIQTQSQTQGLTSLWRQTSQPSPTREATIRRAYPDEESEDSSTAASPHHSGPPTGISRKITASSFPVCALPSIDNALEQVSLTNASLLSPLPASIFSTGSIPADFNPLSFDFSFEDTLFSPKDEQKEDFTNFITTASNSNVDKGKSNKDKVFFPFYSR